MIKEKLISVLSILHHHWLISVIVVVILLCVAGYMILNHFIDLTEGEWRTD